MGFKSLDIGCGETPRGEVGCDLVIPKNRPKFFVVASAEALPFKSKSFDVVRSHYVIEHLTDPKTAILDQLRIARKKLIIVTDNSEWFGDAIFRLVKKGRLFHEEHCYRWTVEYLKNLLNRFKLKSKVFACNLSPTKVVKSSSVFGRLPRIGVWFYRDIYAEIRI